MSLTRAVRKILNEVHSVEVFSRTYVRGLDMGQPSNEALQSAVNAAEKITGYRGGPTQSGEDTFQDRGPR